MDRFGQDFSLWSNIEIPSNDAPRPAIFAMWDDLNPLNDNSNASAAGNVYYYSDIESQTFIIWFDNVVTWQGNAVSGEFDFRLFCIGMVILSSITMRLLVAQVQQQLDSRAVTEVMAHSFLIMMK